MAPSPAPHDRPSFGLEIPPPTTTSPTAQRTAAQPPPAPAASATSNAPAPPPRSSSGSPKGAAASANSHKSSPPSASRNAGGPKIVVKKEPGSPDLPTTRHRPRKLDLSKNSNIVSPATARPLTAREGRLDIQEVGLACLSPGFITQDPVMNANVQRSMTVRDHQRQIIEARLQQQSAKGDGPDKDKDGSHFSAKTPGLARKRGAPPGLSIVAPSHEQFANERVIQSAPLGQTFTGMHPHPLTRHITNQPSKLSSTSHIHHVPATQTNNRLPPIADVFGQNLSGHPESSGHALFGGQSRPAPLASPHHPPPPQQHPPHQAPPAQQQALTPSRPREYKSAEEAQVELAGGRPELLPKLVRYGGHQPPTPPSPPHHHHHPHAAVAAAATTTRDHHPQHSNHNNNHGPLADNNSATSRNAISNNHSNHNHQGNHHYNQPSSATTTTKRRRAEYEEGGSPPLGNGRPAGMRRMMFGGDSRESPEASAQEAQKREAFIRLCGEMWDLLRS
ncbi:hypothetical protein MMYC01_202465 [Madurella mycetomatis]|uniref:Uncharacterized protein n=1 Tax=Madurella mycetomatis TaxID=100816 RepID=A0A175W9S0_9PEZI|nr:hypothetical protein MMYC01_202465 [Madurella mycetomatis]